MSLVINAQGVTQENKDVVCESVATALDGTFSHCSLSGPSQRRRLVGSELYVDVLVEDGLSAQTASNDPNFESSLQGLPSGVQVTSVIPEPGIFHDIVVHQIY